MGMTNKQFNGYLRFIYASLEEAKDEQDQQKKEEKIEKVMKIIKETIEG